MESTGSEISRVESWTTSDSALTTTFPFLPFFDAFFFFLAFFFCFFLGGPSREGQLDMAALATSSFLRSKSEKEHTKASVDIIVFRAPPCVRMTHTGCGR